MAEWPNVVIPTRGRAEWHKQHALQQFTAGVISVTLVTSGNTGDAARYRSLLRVHDDESSLVQVARTFASTIGRVRRWITCKLYYGSRVLMVDDDLRIYYNGVRAGPMEMRQLMAIVAEQLERTPIVLMQGNIGFIALDIDTLLDARVRYGRVPVLEHAELLLRAAARGVQVSYLPPAWRCAQVSGRRKGGCAIYRTPELEQKALRYLRWRYPQYAEYLNCNIKDNNTFWRNSGGGSARKRKSEASRSYRRSIG